VDHVESTRTSYEAGLVVSAEQKITLRQLLQQPRSSRSLAFRARIILECASRQSNAAVAAKLHTTGFTVGMGGIAL
jgi:rhodanese-related sulfurtransferase